MNVVTPISKAPVLNTSPRADLLCILFLWLLGTLAMSPVLIHPHWGMFSDPNQIVEAYSVIFAREFDWNLWQQNMWVDFRPGFHLVDLLTWTVSAHNPAGFYILRYLCFVGTLCLTYLSCKNLGASQVVSLLVSIFWFLAYPTYEVIYTLDKGEIYLGLLFAMFVYGNVAAAREVSKNSLTVRKSTAYLGLLIFSAGYAIFTKQTGLLLLGYSLVLLSLAFIFETSRLSIERQRSLSAVVSSLKRSVALKWALLVAVTSLFAAVTFRVLFVHFGGLSFHYGEVVLSPAFLFSQLLVYLQSIPEFFILYAFGITVVLTVIFKAVFNRSQPDFAAIQATSLCVTILAGVLALLAWKSQVAYIWYPMFSLVLPLVAFSFQHLFGHSRKVVSVALACATLLLLPERILDAETQYNMDVEFNRLIARLNNLPEELRRNANVVVKLKEQSAAELGEEIECALREVKRLSTTSASAQKSYRLNTYNIIRATSGSVATDKTTLTEDVSYPPDYKPAPGFDKFMYLPDRRPHWTVCKVEVGDIILMPYGSVPVKSAPYRGVLCFAKPDNALPESLLQLELQPVMRLSKSFSRFNGKKTEIGWQAYRVGACPTLSLPLADYGWFKNKQKIYYGSAQAGHSLSFDCDEVLAPAVLVSSANESKLTNFDMATHHITLSLPTNENELSVDGSANFDKPVLFRAKKLTVE